ncbi:plasmid partitioning protein RepB C-terminal domain-containing protein [Aggregatibacter actinomycetemcomitans]|uniref:plasmid partitioning protein RepB C-terminal domain-containing protein n=1 Tax=Aggregatibacter actinomycetemcomitans TaxID=714 RepID=UPI0011DCF0F4|nr:ParB N-terminal domain-containing protein [Aggregatibacter actinomycetemcomitans]QEH44949.1 chromosome partitioning protein ParB [Aggregatibacter actinomycetemcomitans]QEH49183.1 chromosome partitioning protein ParB [Aggregatibacter actinomycetemcomitans]
MDIQTIPIEDIRIINPRTRNRKIFADLVENIASVGLKRPITVSKTSDGYNLLCGQGRLEACKHLGEKVIPCRVIEVSQEESYLISLAENIARRKHTNMELLSGIRILSERGYRTSDIARKVGFDTTYISGIIHLLKVGEERLINGVEKGYLPITVAISIARADDKETQKQLTELYENGTLKQSDITKIRNIMHRRKLIGKRANIAIKNSVYSQKSIINIYKEETDRQQRMIKQAEFDESQLFVLISCLKKLFNDKVFLLLLKSEKLNDIPKDLSERLRGNYA